MHDHDRVAPGQITAEVGTGTYAGRVQALITWSGFLGAWLLVAGPIYQASVELNDEELDRDDVAAVTAGLPLPPRVSPWWWLVPPVAYLLHRRRSRTVRRLVTRAMTAQQVAGLVHYLSKATGWIYVGLGGLLLAARETWELCSHYGWPAPAFGVLVLVALGVCVLNAAWQASRNRRILDAHVPE